MLHCFTNFSSMQLFKEVKQSNNLGWQRKMQFLKFMICKTGYRCKKKNNNSPQPHSTHLQLNEIFSDKQMSRLLRKKRIQYLNFNGHHCLFI